MDSAPPAAVDGLAQIALTMTDVAAALIFYRDTLGLRLLFSAGPDLAFLEAGGVRLMLTTPRGHGEPGKNSALYFRVQDLAATYAAVVARGAAPERAPALTARLPDHELWMAFVRDPEGNLVGLMSEVRAPA
jgi:methylmalonyl-CoA/ethylmalonyl-CoA epimerase